MSIPRLRRMVAFPLIALLLASSPTAAADPSFVPETDADASPTAGGSVHAEMLQAHADDRIVFEPGKAPAALPLPAGGHTTDEGGTGGIAGLPNGLRHEVLGYLPYWMLGPSDLANMRYDLVSTIAYFGVPARSDGTLGLSTTAGSGWTSSAMSSVISQAHERGVKVVLTVTMMAWDHDYTDFSKLLKSSVNRAKLATAIANAVKSRNADGVNLDFEPMPNSLESYYTLFVRKVKSELVRLGAGSYLTVATTGGAASWDEGYELVDNADANTYSLVSSGGADALMVMAYDFNWSGSAWAGAVAPFESLHTLDARRAMRDYLALVPSSRLIWGVPYYGRAWTTTSATLNGRTCRSAGTCQAASWASGYVDAREAAAAHGRRWDDTGKVPWYRYESSTYGTWVQGYYDDSASLNVKYDAAKASGMRGVGIWHLLMDGSRDELWDRLRSEFKDLPFTDIARSAFLDEIIWLADEAITRGCSATRFCPQENVNRGEMASFLDRALSLPASSQDWYVDDDGLSHENSINRLAEAEITFGCGEELYCPRESVSRGEMASFLARAMSLPPAQRDWFTDDAGLSHEDAINRIADAGITVGCGGNRFCPSGLVNRQQMAAFLYRALGS